MRTLLVEDKLFSRLGLERLLYTYRSGRGREKKREHVWDSGYNIQRSGHFLWLSTFKKLM